MREHAFIGMMRLLPKNAMSRFVGAATRWRGPAPLRHAAMRIYAAAYGIDLSECADIRGFDTFGDFFARPLKPGLRPIATGDDVVVSPVDAIVSESGVADGGRLVQAKGIDYTLESLVADGDLARELDGGPYVTLYLSPRDYHRIHFPLAGRILGYRYVPGHLWPVTPAAVRRIPGLFCVNERLVTILETRFGVCALVAVGATIVGRIRAYYDSEIPVTNRKHARPRRHDYEQPIPAEKGAEMGAFELGSTVILLFEKGRIEFLPSVYPGARLRVGEPLGRQPAPVTHV